MGKAHMICFSLPDFEKEYRNLEMEGLLTEELEKYFLFQKRKMDIPAGVWMKILCIFC